MLATVECLGVDAAIIFSDLLVLLEPLGLQVEFTTGEGPLVSPPLRSAADVDRLRELESVEPLEFVMDTVRQTRARPARGVAADRFCRGAVHAGRLCGRRRGQSRLSLDQETDAERPRHMGRTARTHRPGNYPLSECPNPAGAQVVQLFDSWVGCLGDDDYRRFVLPYTRHSRRGAYPRRAGHSLCHRQSGAAAGVVARPAAT